MLLWGNGWPEPDEQTPCFFHKSDQTGSLPHPEAIKAQENYLAQFPQQVNLHSGGIQVNVLQLFEEDEENPEADPIYSFQYNF